MKFYFVRHGETELNANKVYQDGLVKLSELGISQAKFVAKRFSHIPVDLIISSPYTRAKQTAEIISKEINKDIEELSSLVEIKRPSEIVGKLHNTSEAIEINNKIKENFSDPQWRYSNEENFFDFRDRAVKTLEYLKNTGKENVLVVTHGGFLRALIGVMLFGESLEPENFTKVASFLWLQNTGITICEYKENRWSMLAWNDFAHLGD